MPISYIDPVADSTNTQWTPTPTGDHWSTVAKGIRQPSLPSTAAFVSSGILNLGTTRVDEFVMAALDIMGGLVTQIIVWVYGLRVHTPQFNTNIAPYGGVYVGHKPLLTPQASPVWSSATFSGLSWTQQQINAMRVRLGGVGEDSLGEAFNRAFALYAEVTYRAADLLCGELTTQPALAGRARI